MSADGAVPTRTDVTAAGGLRLAVWRRGTTGPPIVFVHGFPDTHALWDPVTTRLSGRFRCISYDVRGAGASQAPADRAGYRLAHLVTDLVAVLDAESPTEPVHLVAHDWGSVQAWDAVVRESSDPRLRGRILSYTSISGPCLHHVDAYARAARGDSWRRRREALGQLRHSWYIYAFHVPLLPELFLRGYAWWLRRGSSGQARSAATLARDAVNGLELYRANIFHRVLVPGGPRTSLPVQLVVPLKDRYVTPSVLENVSRFASNLTRRDIAAGHWVARTHPDEVAALIVDFVAAASTPHNGEL